MRRHRVQAAYLFITCHQQTDCHDQSRNASPVCDQYVLTLKDNISVLINKKYAYTLRAGKLIKNVKTVNLTKDQNKSDNENEILQSIWTICHLEMYLSSVSLT